MTKVAQELELSWCALQSGAPRPDQHMSEHWPGRSCTHILSWAVTYPFIGWTACWQQMGACMFEPTGQQHMLERHAMSVLPVYVKAPYRGTGWCAWKREILGA